jgi:hypothetical protein
VTRLLSRIFVVAGFVTLFILEGGHLPALLQPPSLISLLLLAYVLTASHLGFRMATKLFGTLLGARLRSPEATPEQELALIESVASASQLVTLSYWLLIVQHLLQKELLGHLVSAMAVSAIAAVAMLALAPGGGRHTGSRLLASALAVVPAIVGCAVAFMKFG